MKIARFNSLRITTLLFLIVALFGLYPTSVLTMDHDLTPTKAISSEMRHDTPKTGHDAHSAPIQDTQNCINFHLGLMDDFSQSLPLNSSVLLIVALLASLLTGLSFLISQILFLYSDLLRQRLRRLRKKSLEAYIAQLGFWLNLIQKKSPAFAFAKA